MEEEKEKEKEEEEEEEEEEVSHPLPACRLLNQARRVAGT